MREPRKWFSVDSKSFEILVEGEGRSLKGYITERRTGVVSWVRFGGEGLRNFLKGVKICCKEGGNSKRIFDWKENRRFYRLESHKMMRENSYRAQLQTGKEKDIRFSFQRVGG